MPLSIDSSAGISPAGLKLPMDRHRFLIHNSLREQQFPGNCLEEICICDEPALPAESPSISTVAIRLVGAVVLVLAALFVLANLKNEMAVAAMLQKKAANGIACIPGNSNTANGNDNNQPWDNRNNCPHQMITGMACCYEPKRRPAMESDLLT